MGSVHVLYSNFTVRGLVRAPSMVAGAQGAKVRSLTRLLHVSGYNDSLESLEFRGYRAGV